MKTITKFMEHISKYTNICAKMYEITANYMNIFNTNKKIYGKYKAIYVHIGKHKENIRTYTKTYEKT